MSETGSNMSFGMGSPLSSSLGFTSSSTSSGMSKAEFTKKEQLRCMVCGGKDCSKCGLDAYKALPNPAINKLHSHWINESIVAMQRPNDTALDNGALNDMVEKKITAVFNLTQPGEHPYCGTGNLASGFPYTPEKLMQAGIKHFNFSWQDMTVPTLQMMFDIVHIAVAELTNGGKIAVHCHAGFGRTGLTIACILIAKDLLESHQVIHFIRLRRPGSIQTHAQRQFIHSFERSMHLRMQIFPMHDEMSSSSTSAPSSAPYGRRPAKREASSVYLKTVQASVRDQQFFLSPSELHSHRFQYVHKVVVYTCTAMKRLAIDHFIIACLAITGLTRLTIKKNLEMESDETAVPPRGLFPPVGNLPSSGKSARRLLKKKSSFMVATNSLSESGEENILVEVKLELNLNTWTRLCSIADVFAADLTQSTQSSRYLDTRASGTLEPWRRDGSSRESGDLARETGDLAPPRVASPPGSPPATPALSRAASHRASLRGGEGGDAASTGERDAGSPRQQGAVPPQAVSAEREASSPSLRGGMHPPALSLSRLRSNSLRILSDSEMNKSKRMAVNLVAQLLLDWIETRQQALFSDQIVADLGDIWQAHGHRHFHSVKKLNVDDAPASCSPLTRQSSDRPAPSASAGLPRDRSLPRLELAPFNTSVKADKPSELSAALSACLHGRLDRYGLELLYALVSLYRALRRAGRDTVQAAQASPGNAASSRSAASSSGGAGGIAGGTAQPLGLEEFEALEALVGLRLAIACMHARKAYHGLIRQRALVIDLVKVFLLKSTNSELVIINNITFSEETFEHVKNTIGAQLIYRLDVVFRTLRLLAEEEYRRPADTMHGVHWRPDLLSPKMPSPAAVS